MVTWEGLEHFLGTFLGYIGYIFLYLVIMIKDIIKAAAAKAVE